MNKTFMDCLPNLQYEGHHIIIVFVQATLSARAQFGGPVGGINRFIDKLGKLDLRTKWIAVFDTYMDMDFEKAVKKMEKRIGEKVPALKLITSGLSIKVEGMKGPITDGELLKCIDFGKKIVDRLKT